MIRNPPTKSCAFVIVTERRWVWSHGVALGAGEDRLGCEYGLLNPWPHREQPWRLLLPPPRCPCLLCPDPRYLSNPGQSVCSGREDLPWPLTRQNRTRQGPGQACSAVLLVALLLPFLERMPRS